MNITIIGGTGLTGSSITKMLIHNDKITKINFITRRDIEFNHKKIIINKIQELASSSLNLLEQESEVFICCLGTTIKEAGSKENFQLVDKDLVISFARYCKRVKGEKIYIISSLGASPDSSIFYNKIKGEMESDVSKLGLRSVIFLRPSLLIGKRKEKRFLEEVGALVYRAVSKVVPKRKLSKLGTDIEDITEFIRLDLNMDREGIHIQDSFFNN